MSRRKALAVRNPSGRIRQARDAELLPPTEIRRLVTAASQGMRDAVWVSMLGKLHLTGKLTAIQLAAGKRWAVLVADYSVACRSPRQPQTVALDPRGGQPPDPDSVAGQKQARWHNRANAAFIEGRFALRQAGNDAERAVEAVCIRDQAPVGYRELEALKIGLQALFDWWSQAKRKARAR
jgi:hypothetical protein